MKSGLVLAGGGARAAYQVGVLVAIKEILRRAGHRSSTLPTPVLCGTSSGAINAAALACQADDFFRGVIQLERIWSSLTTDKVYRVDPWGLSSTGLRWLGTLMFGWMTHHNPQSLLDNRPLAMMINEFFQPEKVAQAIAAGTLEAFAVSASSYTSGRHVTFFQAHQSIKAWVRTRRNAVPSVINTAHLMASSAIPFIFPAIALPYAGGREYFGDGAIHQIAPISPAIHLGAEKILVIGTSQPAQNYNAIVSPAYPSLAQIGGHALTSLFLDSLAHDIDNIYRLNEILKFVPKRQQTGAQLRHIDVLVITPSQSVEVLASRYLSALPGGLRLLLRGIGVSKYAGATLLSYLLFEKPYIQALIAMGKEDALAKESEILRFFNYSSNARQ